MMVVVIINDAAAADHDDCGGGRREVCDATLGSHRRDMNITCMIVQSPDDVSQEREKRERESLPATPREHASPAQTRSPYI